MQEPQGLNRERIVRAGLGLVQEEGLDGLSMRALADQLEVKAASLYWHVRDRQELVELLADSILETVSRPQARAGWRAAVIEAGAALGSRVAAQRDADRILVEVPEALERSDVFGEIRGQLLSAGLQPEEARDVARMVMTSTVTRQAQPTELPMIEGGTTAAIAIDSGSRGVVLHAGTSDMQTLIRIPHDQDAAAPAAVRGETVVVRRLRGVGRGEIELNPRRPWRFQVQAPTWNTVLDVGALDVREIKIDSGATKVECYLPRPNGVVPINISSGVVGVVLHRPRGVAVIANISTGAVKVKLDDFVTKATLSDVHWASEGASAAADRYELRINSGAVKIELDSYEPNVERRDAQPIAPPPTGQAVSALEILLDGVEARVKSRSSQ